MDESRDDIFQKLEEAVEQWSEQVAHAHRDLADQLERTRVSIDGVETSSLSETATAVVGGVSTEALRDLVTQFGEAVRESASQILELRGEMKEFRAAVSALREEMAALRARLDGDRGHAADSLSGLPPAAPDLSPPRRSEHAGAWKEVARLGAQLDDRPAAESVPDEVPEGLTLEAFDDTGSRRRIGEILVEAGVISVEQLAEALDEQEKAPHRRLGGILIEKGFTGETAIALVLASQLKTRFVRLSEETVDPEALALLNLRVARRHECLPLRATPDRLTLAMANPFDLIAIDDAELASGRRVDPVVATATDILSTLDRLQ